MTAITFKIIKPNSDCRRVTFNAVPELAAINEVVDGLVDFDSRELVYVDSEGDRIIVKSSRDVQEAVRDAEATNAKTVKLWIRRNQAGAGRACGRGAAKASSKDNNQRQRPRCGRGLFRHPGWVQYGFEFNDDVADILEAFFPRCFISRPHCEKRTSDNDVPTSPTQDSGKDSNDSKNDSRDDSNTSSESPKGSASEAGTSSIDDLKSEVNGAEEEQQVTTAPLVEAKQHNATVHVDEVVEDAVPESDIPSQEQENENDLNSKVSMLREMGFDLPDDVAKNMIRELNGRMDLIVRALVANNK